MSNQLPAETTAITLLGVLNGPDSSVSQLRELMDRAAFVIAADGAAERCWEAGRAPDVVIGDLDSLSPETRRHMKEIVLEEDQDLTDTQKLLRYAEAQGYRQITLTGIEGDLPDHALASWGACAQSGLEITVKLRRGQAWVVKSSMGIDVLPGARISLMPLVPCTGVWMTGVEWPVEGRDLSLDGEFSISNRAVTNRVELRLSKGVAILFVLADEKSLNVT